MGWAVAGIVLVVAMPSCSAPRDPGASLAAFEGGFDPTRFDAGVLADADALSLGRALKFHVPLFYADEVSAGAGAALEQYLKDAIGVDVEIVSDTSTYGDVAGSLLRGELDVAELPPYQYALAEARKAGLIPIAATVAHGASTYGSYLVVKQGSSIHSLEQIRGKTLGFVDRSSTSGFLLPSMFLRDRGFDLDKDVRVVFLGSHGAGVEPVRNGTVDVAAVSSDLLIGNTGLAGPLVVLAKAGRTPYDIIVARPDLDRRFVDKVRAALLRLSIHSESGRGALRAFSSVDGFMPVPHGHYDEIRALAQRVPAP